MNARPVEEGTEPADVLRTPAAGALVIRGGALRLIGYGAIAALGAVTSIFLLRGLGVDQFGRYATVAAVLAIVSAVSDAGLTAVGLRELALLQRPEERSELLRNLVALRVLLTLCGVFIGVAFVALAGYPYVVIAGVALGGLGVLLVNTQATLMLPLSIALKVGTVTAVEIVKSAVTLCAIAVLAVTSAPLLAYFGVQVLVGIVVLVITPFIVRSARTAMRPRIRGREARRLLRTAGALAIALALNVLYLRFLVVMVSLQTDAHETGLYGTAFRVIELLVGIPPIVVGVAIPVLAVAGGEDLKRFSYAVERMIEVITVGALGLALVVTVLAEPTLRLLGGPAFVAAAPMLQIQVWALVPLSIGSVLSVTLLALGRQRAIAVANAVALAMVLTVGTALIATHGGKGAAVTGVVAETALLLALCWATARADRGLLPRARFLPKPLFAVGAGLATLLLPLPPWVDGIVAGLVFAVVALGVRAVPVEVIDALRRRAPGDAA